MALPAKDAKTSPSKTGKEVRQEVRDYIKNERDTVLMKWLTLGETVKTIDRTKEVFELKKIRQHKTLPTNIQKFIGTLKRCVRKTIRNKGGTPYSIVWSLFMYWGTGGSGPSGTLNAEQLSRCMASMGVVISTSAIDEVIAYYSTPSVQTTGSGVQQMSYEELLQDVTADEPTVTMDTGGKYFDGDDIAERFTEVEDAYAVQPLIVKQFIEATQNYVMTQMRVEGGTPHHHVRELFNRFDYNQSNGLDEEELQTAAKKKMKLNMTRDQARDVIKFYDRKRTGQMKYDAFVLEISKGTKPMLDFTEITLAERQKAMKSLSANPLMPKPFQPKPNRALEALKLRLRSSVEAKVGVKGGRLESWVSDAFHSYDKAFTLQLSSWQDVQGVMAKLGIPIDRDTASMLLRTYDVRSNGVMHYALFIKDLVSEDSHFLNTVEVSPVKMHPGVSARTPSHVSKTIQMFKNSCNVYERKSGGALKARDLLYGTCLRFDAEKCGRIPPFAVMNVAKELNVPLTQDQVNEFVDWFDSNATHALDYNLLTKQIYGNDVMNAVLQLPKLNKHAGRVDYNDCVRYRSGEKHQQSDTMSAVNEEPPEPKASAPASVFSGDIMFLTGSQPVSPNKKADRHAPKRKVDRNYTPLKKAADNLVGGQGQDGKLNAIAESAVAQGMRLDSKRHAVLLERQLISDKLLEVDATRKRLSDAYSKRKNVAREAQIQELHEARYAERLLQRQQRVQQGQK